MRWLRQHSEDGQGTLVARVSGEPGAYVIALLHPSGASRAGGSAGIYGTASAAVAAAPPRVGNPPRDHACCNACSGGIEDAGTR
jgi:hypothetical protein